MITNAHQGSQVSRRVSKQVKKGGYGGVDTGYMAGDGQQNEADATQTLSFVKDSQDSGTDGDGQGDQPRRAGEDPNRHGNEHQCRSGDTAASDPG